MLTKFKPTLLFHVPVMLFSSQQFNINNNTSPDLKHSHNFCTHLPDFSTNYRTNYPIIYKFYLKFKKIKSLQKIMKTIKSIMTVTKINHPSQHATNECYILLATMCDVAINGWIYFIIIVNFIFLFLFLQLLLFVVIFHYWPMDIIILFLLFKVSNCDFQFNKIMNSHKN